MQIKERSYKQLRNQVRFHALQVLYAVEYEGAYSNIALNHFLDKSPLSDRDNRLVFHLVYGGIQRRLTLDYYLHPYLQGKTVPDWIESLLRLSIYQLVYMDRIPEHAIVNEAVTIAKVNGHPGLGKLVNGILRSFLRQGPADVTAIDDPIRRLSIEYSVNEAIVANLASQMAPDRLASLLASLLLPAFVSLRINPHLTDRPTALQALRDQGYHVEEGALSPLGIRLLSGNAVDSQAYQAGWVTVQDESSMLVAPIGQLQGDERVLDACSAPGGKATHIAALLDRGHLTALDISAAKLNLVKTHLNRLELADKVTLFAADARRFFPKSGINYDKIYVDAPCTGLGLMRRKPEIKYQDFQENLAELTLTQAQLLDHLSSLLKAGGTLIYSTCSITSAENEEMVARFLTEHPDMRLDPITSAEVSQEALLTPEGFIRVWPDCFRTDGFFIARLQKQF